MNTTSIITQSIQDAAAQSMLIAMVENAIALEATTADVKQAFGRYCIDTEIRRTFANALNYEIHRVHGETPADKYYKQDRPPLPQPLPVYRFAHLTIR
jgi:hypothetical protein